MRNKKRLTAFVTAAAYYALFAVLDGLLRLSVGWKVFLIFISGFEYVGIERLLCTDAPDKPAAFTAAEFLCCALAAPLVMYALAAAAGADTGFAAAAALGTAAYRGIFFAAESIFDI